MNLPPTSSGSEELTVTSFATTMPAKTISTGNGQNVSCTRTPGSKVSDIAMIEK
jgi:hypothetical protein